MLTANCFILATANHGLDMMLYTCYVIFVRQSYNFVIFLDCSVVAVVVAVVVVVVVVVVCGHIILVCGLTPYSVNIVSHKEYTYNIIS